MQKHKRQPAVAALSDPGPDDGQSEFSFGDEHLMESIGFAWGTSNPQALSEHDVKAEDELAGALGKFGVSFATRRKKRIAYLYMWPHRMILTLGEKQQARDTTKLLTLGEKQLGHPQSF